MRHGLSVPHCNVQIKTNTFTFNQQNEEEHIGGWCVSEPDLILFLWISVSSTEVMPAFLQLPVMETGVLQSNTCLSV